MKQRSLIQLGIAVLLLATVGAAYAFWYRAVDSASKEAVALAQSLRDKASDAARTQAAKAALGSLAEDEAVLRGYLVREDDVVPFLNGIERSGAALGSLVEVVSVTTDEREARRRIVLSLKITGTFDAVLRTLGSIEYGPYDSRVQSVTLDTAVGEGTWTAAATFAIGMQPAP